MLRSQAAAQGYGNGFGHWIRAKDKQDKDTVGGTEEELRGLTQTSNANVRGEIVTETETNKWL